VPLAAAEFKSSNDDVEWWVLVFPEVHVVERGSGETVLAENVDQESHAFGVNAEVHSGVCNWVSLLTNREVRFAANANLALAKHDA
jgi:hypothetical protein